MKRLHLLSAITVLSGALLPAMGVAHAQRAAGSYAQTTIFAALENGGVYRSSDGGDTWLAADSGLPQTDAQVTVLQAGGSNTIYAGTSGNGVYYSTDGGQRWQDDNGENSDLPIETVVGLAVDRRFGDTVFAAGQDGVVYSNFSGQSWSESRVGTTSNLSAITDDPGDPTTLLVGTENDGIYLSTDYGADWQSTSGIPAN
ncbi:MAG TPA: hypothetical protein VHB98_12710, partial [Chloroflexota bacterium]|nr:hypothetical protein [Chloroflexota bacterium]